MDQNLWEYILNVSRRMAETRALGPLLNDVMDEAISLVGAERGYVVLVDADGSLDFQVRRGQVEVELEKTKDQVSRSVLNQVIETSQPLVLIDAQHDPHFGGAESVIILGLRSIMCVPLINRGRAIGAIYVENRSVRGRFKEEDISPLVIFANQAVVAIENARLFQSLQEAHQQLEARVDERTLELRTAVEQLEQQISERMHAEEVARRERDNAQRYLDITPSIILALDVSGNIMLLNRDGRTILECEQQDVIGVNWFDTFLLAEDRDSIRSIFEASISDDIEAVKEDEYLESLVVTSAGNIKTVLWHTSVLRDEAGKIIGTLSSGEDITERKQAEAALQESEERYRSVIENSHSGILIIDDAYQFIYANDQLRHILGYPMAEIMGHDFREFLSEKSRELVTQNYVRRRRGEKAPNRYEFEIIRKNGERGHVEASVSIITDSAGNVRTVGQILDITERKQAEAALRQSEERYRTLFNKAQDAILVEDENAQIIDANEAASRLFGYSYDELLTLSTTDLETSEFSKIPQAGYYQQDAESTATEFETVAISRDGIERPIWVSVSSFQVGTQKLFLNIIRDLTEREKSEEALRTSEAQLRTFIGALPDLVFIFDQDGRYLEVFETQEYLLIYPDTESLKDKLVHDILPADIADEFVNTIRRTIQYGQPQTLVYSLKVSIGIRWFEGRTAPMARVDDKIETVIWMARDITERKYTEEALQQRSRELALINQASQAFNSTLELGTVLQTILEEMHQLLDITATSFWLLAPESNDLVCRRVTGPGSETLLGWRLLPGQGFTGQVAQSGQPLIVADTALDQQHYGEIEERIGVELHSLLSIPLQVKGEVIGVLNLTDTEIGRFTEQDLTLLEPIAAAAASAVKNARLFNQMEQARESAEHANRAKSVFLATMSHELRTPLNGILGYAQILKRDPSLTEQQATGLDVIEQSGQHLLTLINDVLDMAKVEAGKLELYQTNFNLSHLLTSIAEIMRVRAEDKGLDFRFENFADQEQLPAGVYGDEKRLRQVLINLLGNAIKFTHQGNVTLKVGKVDVDSRGDGLDHLEVQPAGIEYPEYAIRFQIEDTGVGISPEDIATLFEPFRQAGDKRHRIEGTGLGLAISRNMVRLMGGELKIKSTLGEGSIFWFDLHMPEIPGWVEPAESVQQSIIGYRGNRRKILVVDDAQENRAMLFDLLSSLGFEILEATTGQEGLDKTHQFNPDAVLIDLVMPHMSGLDFVRRIRQEASFKEMVIIATSGHVFDDDQRESLAAGCNAFVPKPIQVEILLARLQEFLNLEWLYDTQDHEKTVSIRGLAPHRKRLPSDSWRLDSVEALIPPPPEEVARLFQLAQLGDIAAIREQAERLERMDEKFKPFTAELYDLVRGFQVNQLCQFLEQYLK